MATEIVPRLNEITANVNEITANNKRSSFSKLFGSTPRELKRKTHTITIERASRSESLNVNLAYVEGLGAVVTEIFNKAAAEGGLCAGDVILSIGSQPIATAIDAKNALKCVLGEAELQVSRIESKDGLPRGWKASTDAASGRTVYWRMVQSADGKQWLPRYSHQHPAALPLDHPLRAGGVETRTPLTTPRGPLSEISSQ